MPRPNRTYLDALKLLLELTRRLGDVRPLEESLREVTSVALKLVAADHASIRLLDASRSSLLSAARSGSGAKRAARTFRRGEGMLGWVVERREGVRLDDARLDPRFKPLGDGQGFAIRAMIAEPLWAAGEVIGVISVTSPESGAFSADDQLLLRLLANCSTPPIERARLERLAMSDDLTLAYNKRYLAPRLQEEIERARRTRGDVSLLLLDLDHFKRVNDLHGHAAGDAVLRAFAERVRATVRRVDVFVRRGGEEFLLIMPATSIDQARATAERIRKRIAAMPFEVEPGLALPQTVSVGVATWDKREDAELFERRADEAMYAAKLRGRDCIAVSRTPKGATAAARAG